MNGRGLDPPTPRKSRFSFLRCWTGLARSGSRPHTGQAIHQVVHHMANNDMGAYISIEAGID
ncbi:hypothetical protein J22TS3_49410 [Paenibacillus sp. J22TS3]|nr:hypothetical protein J22TS3_49410 [Paenibacillus sp. J22TS3]